MSSRYFPEYRPTTERFFVFDQKDSLNPLNWMFRLQLFNARRFIDLRKVILNVEPPPFTVYQWNAVVDNAYTIDNPPRPLPGA